MGDNTIGCRPQVKIYYVIKQDYCYRYKRPLFSNSPPMHLK